MESPLVTTLNWLSAIATGPAAVGIGGIAVATIGLGALRGYLDVRRALQVLLGLFVLFAGPDLVIELQSLAAAAFAEPIADPQRLPQAEARPICWTCG